MPPSEPAHPAIRRTDTSRINTSAPSEGFDFGHDCTPCTLETPHTLTGSHGRLGADATTAADDFNVTGLASASATVSVGPFGTERSSQ